MVVVDRLTSHEEMLLREQAAEYADCWPAEDADYDDDEDIRAFIDAEFDRLYEHEAWEREAAMRNEACLRAWMDDPS